jgi:hypothetical protein
VLLTSAELAGSLKLRLLSIRPAGALALRGVLLDTQPAEHAQGDASAGASAVALQGGGGAAGFMGLLAGAMAAGLGRGAGAPASGRPPPELLTALRGAAAARDAAAGSAAAAVSARVDALDAAMSGAEAPLGVRAPPPASAREAGDAVPASAMAALAQRVARLERRCDHAFGDIAARLRALEAPRAAAAPLARPHSR